MAAAPAPTTASTTSTAAASSNHQRRCPRCRSPAPRGGSTWLSATALAEPPPTDPAVVLVTVVDCSAPHQAETFLRASIPVDAAVTDVANERCAAGFTAYTGRLLPAATPPSPI